MIKDPSDTVKDLPKTPGVYIMKDSSGQILYIGKAKSLRHRVASYFLKNRDIKTRTLMSKVDSIDHISTDNEFEALILENNLIKQWNPRYNISLKDGKSYPVIRITNEAFPKIFKTRRIIEDGSEYFGPFPDVGSLDLYLELIQNLYPLRKCRGPLKKRASPCLYYHMNRCSAPCCGKISREEYHNHIISIKSLLSGETEELKTGLKRKMETAVAKLDFEEAAHIRDSLEAIKVIEEKQTVQDFNMEKRDYIAFSGKENLCVFTVFQMRDGKLSGKHTFRTEFYSSEEEALAEFLLRYYETTTLPDSLFIEKASAPELIHRFFRQELGRDTEILHPAEKRDKSILRLAKENGNQDLEKRLFLRRGFEALKDLQKALNLPSPPLRIEGFDISHLSGKYTVASMVSFLEGMPDKRNYRTFHIKSLKGRIDDFEAIREVVARRYSKILNENIPAPDLILIDGGKGQVSAAREILESLGLSGIPLAGLAKKLEEIFLPDKESPVILQEGSDALRVLQSVRDEAHRFATSFNKRLREKDTRFSLLESIPGVGPKRSALLLTKFGSLSELLNTPAEKIALEGKLPLSLAEKIKLLSQHPKG